MSWVWARAIAVSCSSIATAAHTRQLSIAVDQRQQLRLRLLGGDRGGPDAGAAGRGRRRLDPAIHGKIREHGAARRAARDDLDLVPAVRAALKISAHHAVAQRGRLLADGAVGRGDHDFGMRETARDPCRDRRVAARRQAPRDRVQQRDPSFLQRRARCRACRRSDRRRCRRDRWRPRAASRRSRRARGRSAGRRRASARSTAGCAATVRPARSARAGIRRRRAPAASSPRTCRARSVITQSSRASLSGGLRRCLRAAARTSASNARPSSSRGGGLRPSAASVGA